MHSNHPLPPGQKLHDYFPRFGLTWFAWRFPTETGRITLHVSGDVEAAIDVSDHLRVLPRSEQLSDFHCVTSWSRTSIRWGGIRFRDFYEQLVVPQLKPALDVTLVVLFGQDGYRNTMLLEDLLADDVMLADTLDNIPLPMEHGAPLRLVAPAHYGYKNVKHVHRIEFWREDKRHYRFPGPGFMSHPRARVALQERGKYLPGWCYRLLYRPAIGITAWTFRVFSKQYHRKHG